MRARGEVGLEGTVICYLFLSHDVGRTGRRGGKSGCEE